MALKYQWRKDGADLAGATSNNLNLVNVQRAAIGAYDVAVSNAFGVVTSTAAFLEVNLATTEAFNPNPGGEVYALAIQSDGKILVGGNFGTLGRLNGNGTLDPSFSLPANASVFSLAVLADGKILAAGWFTTLGGQPRAFLGRSHVDGSLDLTFNPGATGGTQFPGMYAVVAQPDGKIIVGGDFRNLGGLARTNIGRLNADGTPDDTFAAAADNIVYVLSLQPDGKILVGGVFSNLCGQACSRIGRLSDDGSFDATFNSAADDVPLALAIQPDGRIVIGGVFTRLAGQVRHRIARLNTDGSVDNNFNPGANGSVRSLALQSDGKILMGGGFTMLGGMARTNLARLNPDGTPDHEFNPGAGTASSAVFAVTVQDD